MTEEYNAPQQAGGEKGLAIASMVCGILSLVCFGPLAGLPAVIMGHMSMGRIKRGEMSADGKGFALAGLIMGYLCLVGTVLFILFYVVLFGAMFAAGAAGQLN